MKPALELAQRVAARIGALEGVAAVPLGGSWARGEARPGSDVDLGVYYEPELPFRTGDLRRLARELDDHRPDDAVTERGEWGPWINGGGWLVIGGQRVDWLYRDLALVRRTIEECRAGRPALHHQPGHPTASTPTPTSARSTTAAPSTTPKRCCRASSPSPIPTRRY